MKTLRFALLGLTWCLGTVSQAIADDEYGPGGQCFWHMPGMGPGGAWMMQGPMMGPGPGWMMGAGPGPGWMMGLDPDAFSDEYLDNLGESIAQRHRLMQRIASEQDQAARRALVREHLASVQGYGRRGAGSGRKGDADSGRRYGHGWMMGRGGMMGYGMMDPDQFSDEYLDRMGERMAQRFKRMQQIADTTDKAERRELLRKDLESMYGSDSDTE